MAVSDWLESLVTEQRRYEDALNVSASAQDGYRTRNFESYWLGALQRELDQPAMPTLSPWSVQLEANGPLITADGSWRHRQDAGTRVSIYLEIHWGCLYVKAAARQGGQVVDPRPLTNSVIDALEKGLQGISPGVMPRRARFKQGNHNSLLKLHLALPCDPGKVRALMAKVAEVWDPITKLHGFLP